MKYQGNGYFGYSMSNNAVSAYNNDEKPMSKWRKSDIIELAEDNNIYIKTMPKYKQYLEYSSYHHTSKFYNVTDFYEINWEQIHKDISNGQIKLYSEEEYNAKKDVEYQKREQKRIQFEKLEKNRELEEQKQFEELASCSRETRKSRKGNIVTTFIITDKQPLLYKAGYFGFKDMTYKLGVDYAEYKKI